MPPVRVLHFVDHLGIGGTEKSALLLARHLPRDRFEAHMACRPARLTLGRRLKYRLKALLGNPKHEGKVESFDLKNARLAEARAALGADRIHVYEDARGLATVLRAVSPGVLHIHALDARSYEIPLTALIASGERPVVFATSVFGRDDEALPAAACDRVLFMSRHVRERIPWAQEPALAPRCGFLWNPIEVPETAAGPDLRDELAIPRDAYVLGRVGRPSNHIHDPIAVEAAARLDPRPYLLAVAPPPQLEADVRRLGLAATTRFLAPTTDGARLAAAYRTMDVLAHARRDGETFGCNIAEAMAHGRPVVSHRSRKWNAHEEVIDPEAGFLVGVGDVEAYARALTRLRDDPALRARMGSAARRLVLERFEASKIAAALAAMYETAFRARVREGWTP